MKPWLRATLILLSIGGGFAGVSLSIPLFANANFGIALIIFVFILMYAFVAATGLLFALDERKTKPLCIALALQLPFLSSPLLIYKFGAGFLATLFMGGPSPADNIGFRVGWEWYFGAFWRFGLLENAPWTVGINIVPLVMLILLRRAVHDKEKAEIVEVETAANQVETVKP
jgi:hypothetical protein